MDPPRLARVGLAVVFSLVMPHGRAAAEASPITVIVAADRDDDDVDGRPDGEQDALPVDARADLVPLDAALEGATLRVVQGAGKLRVWAGARPLAMGKVVTAGAAWQGVEPGHVDLVAKLRSGHDRAVSVDVVGAIMRDLDGRAVDLARSHASLDRTPPALVNAPDPDALKALLEVPAGAAIDASIESYSAAGVRLDALPHVALAPTGCVVPRDGVRCFETAPLRFVVDDIDRAHPLVVDRSLRSEVGGVIVIRSSGRKQAIRVLGPRQSEVGPIGRYRLRVRTFVLRSTLGGTPAVGGNDAGAVATMRAELALASATWGQCGISFGEAAKLDVTVMDPPPRHLLSIGDDLGLPASGGDIKLRIDGKAVDVTVTQGQSVDSVAHEVAAAIVRAGFLVTTSSNARTIFGAKRSVDLSVRRLNGTLASLDAARSPTNDATLSVRIGAVDPSNGIEHFGDMDSNAGTLEERTLIKAVDDNDAGTVELMVVPYFSGTGRIGESFITGDSPSMRNVVLVDRGGIRARRSSFTLAHELGHLLLQAPGHPDDYGVDTPTLLMDSDASDASPYGPRRLTIAECARVLRESGPMARAPLLTAWPVGPLSLR